MSLTIEGHDIDNATTFTSINVPCTSAPGFLVNRILMPYLMEAVSIAQDGVPLATIDRAATDFGMPMGPIELADTVGLDVCLHVGEILAEAFDTEVPEALRARVDAGDLGRKSGRGFYTWTDGKATKPATDGTPAPEDLQDRLILPMLNVAVACLREGVVSDEELLDAGVIFGTGFAPFRGGPMAYARSRGIDQVREALASLSNRHGERFRPDSCWDDLN